MTKAKRLTALERDLAAWTKAKTRLMEYTMREGFCGDLESANLRRDAVRAEARLLARGHRMLAGIARRKA